MLYIYSEKENFKNKLYNYILFYKSVCRTVKKNLELNGTYMGQREYYFEMKRGIMNVGQHQFLVSPTRRQRPHRGTHQ